VLASGLADPVTNDESIRGAYSKPAYDDSVEWSDIVTNARGNLIGRSQKTGVVKVQECLAGNGSDLPPTLIDVFQLILSRPHRHLI
jgi:hypothetical protein